MMAPFFKFGYFGDEMGLVVAFLIGLAFGVCLEQAGFGSARKLAAQFYFRDMSVLKVMFSAIVTAMLGVFYLSWMGFLDLTLVHLTPTYIGPQVAGGLLLGIGFVMGGYCPGTSIVALATAKLDAVAFLLGIGGGILAYAELYPRLHAFAVSGNMGTLTLPEFFHLRYGIVVFAVVIMALGAFAAATWAEKKFA